MIIFDSRKKIASNWADEKWVTQKIQHILNQVLDFGHVFNMNLHLRLNGQNVLSLLL